MKTLDLKLTRIGNSQGVRLPVALIKRYGFSGSLAVEAREDGLLLKPKKARKLSWEQTYKEMAAADEDWSEWERLPEGRAEPWDGPSEAEFLRHRGPASARKGRRKKPAA